MHCFFNKDFVKDGGVAIVGSSPSLLGKNLGDKIDSYENVVRFNFASVNGFEASVGSKTTARVVGMTITESHLDKFSFIKEREDSVIVTKDKNRQLLSKVYDVDEIVFFKDYVTDTRNTFRRLEEFIGEVTDLKKAPRTGLVILSMLLECYSKNKKIDVYGFDLQVPEDGPWQNHYFSDKKRVDFYEKMKKNHIDVSYEVQALNKIRDSGLVNFF